MDNQLSRPGDGQRSPTDKGGPTTTPMRIKLQRDCIACGATYGSVIPTGVCPTCGHKFDATPTHIALAGQLGPCNLDGLLAAIADYHDIPYLKSLDQPICKSLANRVPESIAREHRLIPVIVGDVARFAVRDPMEENLSELLLEQIGELPEFAVAQRDAIWQRINEHYGVLPSRMLD
ncbi:GspE/PulE/PilB domain-containing protein [Rhodopirellula europaea]|uniref:Type II secretion system protein GspE N-terminal domain-containing protein n=1 Tax=Rhodopirellula europaea 6C TaxID=1263867 RepID=M2A680_9BACT|nr:hypothetical protein [Rhodopirellula europaea]EMB16086.1 hypothetical protein RE6C_03189 [Rhodopirellula europaea 6C]